MLHHFGHRLNILQVIILLTITLFTRSELTNEKTKKLHMQFITGELIFSSSMDTTVFER